MSGTRPARWLPYTGGVTRTDDGSATVRGSITSPRYYACGWCRGGSAPHLAQREFGLRVCAGVFADEFPEARGGESQFSVAIGFYEPFVHE